MIKLSAIVLTKNEEQNIAKCLTSLKFCDQIIVIDDNSTDKTVSIAHKFGAEVYNHGLKNNFSAQRNFGLTHSKNDWVLFIDADEIVTTLLAKEVRESIDSSDIDGYFIKRSDYWLGRKLKYGEFGQVCLLRLGRKTKGGWVRSVHEHWLINGETSILKHSLEHYPHPSVKEFLKHINFHSNLHAKENKNEGKKASFWKILVFPLAKFLKNFIFQGAILDGTHGFVAAVLMSFHSFLAWSEQWETK